MNSSRPSAQFGTLCAMLEERASEQGSRPLYTFLTDGDSAEQTFTYADLQHRAKQIGGWLLDRKATGQRVLLVYPQGLEYIAAYFGCLYAGAIAVPAYPPRRNRRATRICSMVGDANIELALTTHDLLESLVTSSTEEPSLSGLTWHASDRLSDDWVDRWSPQKIDSDSIAFLQYTSGSTGTPKGVVITHGNLLHNQSLIHHAFGQTSSTVVAGWLPLHHDMGLIGNILHPLYLGGRLVFMSPVDFLQQPIRWLKMISKYGVTISGGPNFGYNVCVEATTDEQRAGLDLSSWECAFNGAEPVSYRTMSKFATAFSDYGFDEGSFCPCYGMAETTLLVTGCHKREPIIKAPFDAMAMQDRRIVPAEAGQVRESSGRPAQVAELCGCGVPESTTDVRIVDPETCHECPPDRIGEIWVSNRSVGQGYWGRDEQSEEIFRARLKSQREGGNSDPERVYLRTGDLGFFHDGQLFITGRLKDLIIVRGANHYPQDIELTTESSHESLMTSSSAAFATLSDEQEQVVIVQEVKRSHMRSIDSDEVIMAIREAVANEHQIPLSAVLLVRPGGVPKTTSGKVQRGEARRMYLADEFKKIAAWEHASDAVESSSSRSDASAAEHSNLNQLPDAEGHSVQPDEQVQANAIRELRDWMIDRIATRLNISPRDFDPRQPFARYGMDSLMAVRLTGEVSEYLGKHVPPTLAYDYPNVDALTRFLIAGETVTTPQASPRSRAEEPVAIIGIACRFPGADSPAEFWGMLSEGRHGISEAPVTRWGATLQSAAQNVDPMGEQSLRGGFLRDVDRFDAGFFGINPREADEIDPQQRLFMEVAWEVFEDAGVPVDHLAGTRTGVFVGVSSSDYQRLESNSQHATTGYSATGNSLAVIANRVSYNFDFRGPSWSVDTACSSSLVAVHHGCVNLRRGDCDLALVGGVSLILSPDTTRSFTQAGMLSPTATCHSFAASADGFVRGEGCGAILLKPLSKAIEDGNRVYGILRGSAVNQDGRSNGLTAPNGVSQQAVIRSALADAGLSPDQVHYVEAHGTGTELGDPIELSALGAVYGPDRDPQKPLLVGSVKTNIGHLEGAAGIAGLIKVCLALHHGTIPRHLNFDEPSPHIDWSAPIKIASESQPWIGDADANLAGVSSFGFGGTNASVIVEGCTIADQGPQADDKVAPKSRIITLSAKSGDALRERARELCDWKTSADFRDVCQTSNQGRVHWRHRLAVSGDGLSDVIGELRKYSQGDESKRVIRGVASRDLSLPWLFGGQGGRAVGAGKHLYDACPGFRTEFDSCERALEGHWPRSLKSILWEEKWWGEVDIQLGLFCLQYATAQLWKSWGVTPSAVLGHSLGEYAAAAVAGLFSLDDAIRLVARRAELVQHLSASGSMLVVFAPEAEVLSHLNGLEGQVEVAVVNGPKQTVVSGIGSGIDIAADRFESSGLRTHRLPTTHAFHSPLIEPVLDEFLAVAEQVEYHHPSIPYLSSMLGERADEQVTSAAYWRRHMREPVRYYQATTNLLTDNDDSKVLCIEMGAGAMLASLNRAAHPGGKLPTLPALSGKQDEWERMLDNLGHCYATGADIDWAQVDAEPWRAVSLPTYPFERRRHWFDRVVSERDDAAQANTGQHVHPLLGNQLDLGIRDIIFDTDVASHEYLADHRVGESIVFPAAGYLELALAAGETAGVKRHDVENLKIERPLSWSEGDSCQVQVVLSTDDDGFACRMVYRNRTGKWDSLATCSLRPVAEEREEASMPQSEGSPISPEEHYERCREVGLDYGPAFQGVVDLIAGESRSWGTVELPDGLSDSDYMLHPAALDGCLQVIGAALGRDRFHRAWLPVEVGRYSLVRRPVSGSPIQVQVEMEPETSDEYLLVTLRMFDQEGAFVGEVRRLGLKPTRSVDPEKFIFRERWCPKIRQSENSPVLRTSPSTDIAARLLESRELIARETGLQHHVSILEGLERLCGHWTAFVIRQLGVEWRPGRVFLIEELASEAGVAPEFHRLLRRLLQILDEDGYLLADGERWRVVKPLPQADPVQESADLLEGRPEALPELTLLERCAAELPSVLRGEVDALPLLFPQDGSISAAEVYRDSCGGQALNRLVAEAVKQVSEALPTGRGIRILEIGAGTGATTNAVLPLLDTDRCEYVFTDLAPGFLAAAKGNFSEYPQVVYRVLDIEKDPIEQGFEAGHFDLVIAANVLHATADLRQTISNVSRIMNPGGQLVVIEGTRPVRWLDLTFGLTSGWWRFEDTDLRPDYPLLAGNGWRALLSEQGFSEPSIIDPLPVGQRDIDPENSVILSELLFDAPPINATSGLDRAQKDRRFMILADPKGLGNALVDRLQLAGHSCVHQPFRIDSTDLAAWVDTRIHYGFQPTDVAFLLPVDQIDVAGFDPAVAFQLGQRILELVQSLAQVCDGGQTLQTDMLRMWIVTEGGQAVVGEMSTTGLAQSTMWGIVRTLSQEIPDWQTRGIELDPANSQDENADVLRDELLPQQQDAETEIAFRRGIRLARRIVREEPRSQPTVLADQEREVLEILSRGSLDGLRLDRRLRLDPKEGEIEVEVRASGLNFRDVLNTLDLYPGQPPLGAECTGIVSRVGPGVSQFTVGDHVAVVTPDSFCDYLTTPISTTIRIDKRIPLEEAATIPIAFLTSAVALEEYGRIAHGTKVLIHAATGGVGLAAIQLAQGAGAEIFATASVEKHDTLRALGIEHVYDSRSTGFAQKILEATSGSGVDVILNSLGGPEFLSENLACLSPSGRYLDIAKTTAEVLNPILDTHRSPVEYQQIDLATMLVEQPEMIQRQLKDLFERMSRDEIRALPFRSFDLREYAEAFRWMRSTRHIGKILLRSKRVHTGEADEAGVVQVQTESETEHDPVSVFRPNATYVITGGLGGLGLAVAEWMAFNGAKSIALVARRNPTRFEKQAIQRIESKGCRIISALADVAVFGELERVMVAIRDSSAPLAGIFHLAGVLDDALMVRQTPEKYETVYGPKVLGAWNLHQLTLEDHLDYFVLFSSVASFLGSPGQSNHSAANAFLDSLAWYRQSLGLVGLSINWGPWSDIGAAAAKGVEKRGDSTGIKVITPAEGLAVFKRMLTKDRLQGGQFAAFRLDVDRLPSQFKRHPLFERLLAAENLSEAERNNRSTFLKRYKASPPASRRDLLIQHLQSLVASTLGLEGPGSIPRDEALFDLGLDSLTSLELRNTLEATLQFSVPATLVFDYPTLAEMADHFMAKIPDMEEVSTPSLKDDEPHGGDDIAGRKGEKVLDHSPNDVKASIENLHLQNELQVAPSHTSETESQVEGVGELIQSLQQLNEELDRWEDD